MSKFDKKILSENLRRSGRSIGTIAKQLEISKSSASIWCRELMLSNKQKETLRLNTIRAGNIGRLKGAKMNMQKRLLSLDKAREFATGKITKISDNELFLAGLCLYWAEGAKSNSSKLTFTNSDPRMICFILKWLKKNFSVQSNDIIPRISINIIHKPRENKILEYWSATLNIPKSQFRKTTFIKTKLRKIYTNHNNYFGILFVGVHKSTMIWYKILACINRIKQLPI